MTGMVRISFSLCLALLFAVSCITAGCGGEERKSAYEKDKASQAPTGTSNIANQGSNAGPTAIQIQCADCMKSFDQAKMSEIGGRWYCEACASKHR